MATSSIPANFSIKDPQEARAFVNALLSKSRPQTPPARKRNWTFANSVKEIERKRTKVCAK